MSERKKYKKRTVNNRAEKVKQEITGNNRKASMRKIMRASGYSDNYSNQPDRFMKTKEGKSLIKKLIVERNRALKAMEGKIDNAQYRDMVTAVDKLTDKIQLLQGEPTENTKITGGVIILPAENEE